MATIDILIPTYNGARLITPTLKSLLSQSYSDFNIIICDDASTDATIPTIKSLKNSRIKIYTHQTNLGYPKNLERGRHYCTAPILFLFGQDDILAKNSLQTYVDIFKKYPQVGAITRPYFWFDQNISLPVRAKKSLRHLHTIINPDSSYLHIHRLFDSLDQLSGLAYRRHLIDIPFHPDIFPCHIYPFTSIFLQHPVCFLSDYTVAVRIASSQSRHLSSIYNKSPILSWYQMFQKLFIKPQHQKLKNHLIANFMAKNYIGLVQIKNYSTFKNLLREIYYLIKFRPQNLFSPFFWFFGLGTIIIPSSILIPLVDWYKNQIYSKNLKHIKFSYQI